MEVIRGDAGESVRVRYFETRSSIVRSTGDPSKAQSLHIYTEVDEHGQTVAGEAVFYGHAMVSIEVLDALGRKGQQIVPVTAQIDAETVAGAWAAFDDAMQAATERLEAKIRQQMGPRIVHPGDGQVPPMTPPR